MYELIKYGSLGICVVSLIVLGVQAATGKGKAQKNK